MHWIRQAGWFVAAALVAATLPRAAGAEPQRIVSLNLCADQILIELADRDAIASLSFLSHEKGSSVMATEARAFPINRGRAEEIITLDPDLVLAGRYTTRTTVDILRRLGYRVVELGVADDLAGVRRSIRTIAAAIGRPERGEALIRAFDARLTAAGPQPGAPRPLAAIYWPRGYSSGDGTLAADALAAAGFDNLAIRLGLQGTARLPLEVLLHSRADLIVLDDRGRDAPAVATEVFRHPALAKTLAGLPRVSIPASYWICGIPAVAEAVERLAAARDRINADTPRARP